MWISSLIDGQKPGQSYHKSRCSGVYDRRGFGEYAAVIDRRYNNED
jgi:hypothetical protein